MLVSTVQDIIPNGDYDYQAPFLIVNHKVRDIGLVGWNNNRWTHQDKAQRNESGASSASQTLAPPSQYQTAWKQAFDPDSCRYYFYNMSQGLTSWEAPDGAFTPDETVDYYVQRGIAEPWMNMTGKHESHRKAAINKIPQSSTSACSAPPSSVAQAEDRSPLHQAGQATVLTPAHTRFSPSKKGDLGKDVERYWVLRYSLFSRWSLGVVLNEKSLFSVTPEVIAKHHAEMLRGGVSVLDAFCGCGGNTIHLAAEFDVVRMLQSVCSGDFVKRCLLLWISKPESQARPACRCLLVNSMTSSCPWPSATVRCMEWQARSHGYMVTLSCRTLTRLMLSSCHLHGVAPALTAALNLMQLFP